MKKTISIIILIMLMLISLYTPFNYFIKTNSKKNYLLIGNNHNELNEPKEVIDYKKNYNNNDIVGTLEILNTDYIVPLLQGKDNDYYLNHDSYGNYNYLGSIYLDYRLNIDTSKKLLIFGHNSSNIDMPFKILENYYNEEYYNNHKYIDITTGISKKRYEIFSVHIEVKDFSYMKINYQNNEEYLNSIKILKERSMYKTDIELSDQDEVLILQTCSTHPKYNNYSKKYLLIALKKIDINKTTHY